MMQVDITIFVNVLILHPFLPKWMNGDIGMFVMIAINLLKTHMDKIAKII